MSLPPQHLFAEIYLIHGHRCPMSTLGGRLGFAAREMLADPGPFAATYFIDTCAADGISIMTGCKKSDGSLRIVPENRHALWLRSENKHGIFAELSEQALELAGEYRVLDQAFLKEEASLTPREREERRTIKAQALDLLLEKFWNLSDEALMLLTTELPAGLARKHRPCE